MAKRVVFRIMPDKRRGLWRATAGGKKWALSEKKGPLVELARDAAQQIMAQGGHAQMVVYKRNGRIQYEHTYRDDPRSIPG